MSFRICSWPLAAETLNFTGARCGFRCGGEAESHMPPCDCCDTQRTVSDAHRLLWWGQIPTGSLAPKCFYFFYFLLISSIFLGHKSVAVMNLLSPNSSACMSLAAELQQQCHRRGKKIKNNVQFVRFMKKSNAKLKIFLGRRLFLKCLLKGLLFT